MWALQTSNTHFSSFSSSSLRLERADSLEEGKILRDDRTMSKEPGSLNGRHPELFYSDHLLHSLQDSFIRERKKLLYSSNHCIFLALTLNEPYLITPSSKSIYQHTGLLTTSRYSKPLCNYSFFVQANPSAWNVFLHFLHLVNFTHPSRSVQMALCAAIFPQEFNSIYLVKTLSSFLTFRNAFGY